jgi:hypothetical protein
MNLVLTLFCWSVHTSAYRFHYPAPAAHEPQRLQGAFSVDYRLPKRLQWLPAAALSRGNVVSRRFLAKCRHSQATARVMGGALFVFPHARGVRSKKSLARVMGGGKGRHISGGGRPSGVELCRSAGSGRRRILCSGVHALPTSVGPDRARPPAQRHVRNDQEPAHCTPLSSLMIARYEGYVCVRVHVCAV